MIDLPSLMSVSGELGRLEIVRWTSSMAPVRIEGHRSRAEVKAKDVGSEVRYVGVWASYSIMSMSLPMNI